MRKCFTRFSRFLWTIDEDTGLHLDGNHFRQGSFREATYQEVAADRVAIRKHCGVNQELNHRRDLSPSFRPTRASPQSRRGLRLVSGRSP
jgi:hypothetical protein